MVRERGLEPPRREAPDPKSGASAIPPLPRKIGILSLKNLKEETPLGGAKSYTKNLLNLLKYARFPAFT